ncbi:MAG: amidohydrolase family protein [Chitinophagales bacterium]
MKQTLTSLSKIYILLFLLNGFFLQAQSVEKTQVNDNKSIVLKGGTAHIGNGEVIENSLIILENGKIKDIGTVASITDLPENAETIELAGKEIYPSFIAANTNMGLAEIGAVRATRDYQETGVFNPNVRSIIAYNTDSEVTPTVRSNGVLLAQVTPNGGAVSGQSSIVELEAWNWEDAAYKMDDAIYMAWPRMFSYSWKERKIKKNEKYEKQTSDFEQTFAEAKAYCSNKNGGTTNLKLEAMCDLFSKNKKLYVKTDYIKEIVAAVHFAKKFELELVIVGGQDSWMATDILKDNNVAIIINKTHNLPRRADEDVDLPYKLPKILQDAGILYCITVGSGWDGFWDQRNISFEAGTAAAYGLTKEQALMSITSNAAKILGIDETVGTLEKGKDATLIVSKGDALDMRTHHIEQAFIRGRSVDLDNKQKKLYRKFMTKYEKEIKQH